MHEATLTEVNCTVCLLCASALLDTCEWVRGSGNKSGLTLALVELSETIQEAISTSRNKPGLQAICVCFIVWLGSCYSLN